MRTMIILIACLALAACGGGTPGPCERPDWMDIPDCVPPVHLPCPYPSCDATFSPPPPAS